MCCGAYLFSDPYNSLVTPPPRTVEARELSHERRAHRQRCKREVRKYTHLDEQEPERGRKEERKRGRRRDDNEATRVNLLPLAAPPPPPAAAKIKERRREILN